MGKPLIIVESPAKAKTITKYLHNNFIVKASMGHVRDLPEKGMGIDLENNFTPTYVVDSGKKKIIADLKESAKSSESIYLASDHDREGEAIAWHLAQVLEKEIKGKPVHRIVFNEITQKAIQEALQNPSHVDINKVDAQQARRLLDRIVGFKISPLLWKLLNDGSLSAGRVQSVALRLICEIDDKIKAFIPEEYWSIETNFWKGHLSPFKAVLHQYATEKIELKNEQETQKIAEELHAHTPKITSYKQTERYIQPPPSFITSTLQQDASKILNFTGKKTMMIAQQLYEGLEMGGETIGLITYMRTDSLRIAEEAISSVRTLINEKYGSHKLHPTIRTYKNKNAAQDAHEAIRPTYPHRFPESIKGYLNNDQYKLYELIWNRFVATQMIPIQLSTIALEIGCGKGLFKAAGSVFLEKGFYEIYPHLNVSLGEVIHPDYQIHDLLEKSKLECKQHFTKPPSYYTEAQLIKDLEAKGIGRPSTYASITNTIVDRKYVVIKEKKYYPTDLGHAVNRFLVYNFGQLFNVTFTAEMETKLDDIEYGKQIWQHLLGEYYQEIKKLMEQVNMADSKKEISQVTDVNCPKCQAHMVIKLHKGSQFLGCSNYPQCKNILNFTRDEVGRIVVTQTAIPQATGILCEKCHGSMVIKKTKKGSEFLACSNYPKCKNALNFIYDSDGKVVIKETLTTNEKCEKCGADMAIKSGRYGEFLGCTGYPTCKNIKPLPTKVQCPECQKGEIIQKKGKKGIFYACSNYPSCKYTSNTKPS